MKILCLPGILVFFIIGCHRNNPPAIPDGPEYSSAVLRYYSENIRDTLKTKAACFLLSHLQQHQYSNTGKPDSSLLTKNQFIKHIEHKFHQLDSCPWLTGISFENFSEYLLPGNIDCKTESTRTGPSNPYRERFNYIITHYDDCLNSSYQLVKLLLKDPAKREKTTVAGIIPEIPLLRDLGIPVTIDFLPVTNRENLKKAWMFIPDDRLQPQMPNYMHADRTGKVYRKTFSRQPIPQPAPGEYIPPFFRNPFQKDVTSLYLHTRAVTLPVPNEIKAQHAYLAMFNDSVWQPVAWGKIADNHCRFEQLGTQNIYLPVYYQDSLPKTWTAPFILETNGKICYLTGDTTSVNLTINRMRPYYYNSDRLNNYFPGTHFESADDATFKNGKNKYAINYPHYQWGRIKLTPPCQKRYWRHTGHPRFPYYLAELQFLDTTGQVLSGKFFGPDIQNAEAITDNNPDTYKGYKGWIGVDLGKPVFVSEIRYLLTLPHRIRKNHHYELLYFYEGRWQCAAARTAPGEEITFPAIPAGFLYRLADTERNEYSNIFTIQDQKIQFR